MTKFLVLGGVVLGTLFAIYWFMIRPVLRSNPSLKPIFDALDHQEATFWGLFTTLVKGWKNVIWARFLAISGVVATMMAEVLPDIQSILQVPGLDEWLAPRWVSVLGISLMLIGLINERLRRATNGPVADVPAADPIQPIPAAPAPPAVPEPGEPVVIATETGEHREVPAPAEPAPAPGV